MGGAGGSPVTRGLSDLPLRSPLGVGLCRGVPGKMLWLWSVTINSGDNEAIGNSKQVSTEGAGASMF
jgi:hypothetical protein